MSGPSAITGTHYEPFGNGASNEVQFYNWAIKQPNLSDQEKTYLDILREKLKTSHNAAGTLNYKEIQAQLLSGPSGTSYRPGSSPINPVVVKTTGEISKRNNNHKFSPVAKKSGLYKDSDNIYYFVMEPKKVQPYKNSGLTSGASYVKDTLIAPPSGSTDTSTTTPSTKFPSAKTTTPSSDDLIFHSPDYQTTFSAAVEDISMSLIRAGDHIISNFDYQSIDSVPDINVQIKYQDAVYLSAREIFEVIPASKFIESIIDDSDSSLSYEAASGIITYLEETIGDNATYKDLLNYYGNFRGDIFTAGKINVDNGLVDFLIELPSDYELTDVVEYMIRFDAI